MIRRPAHAAGRSTNHRCAAVDRIFFFFLITHYSQLTWRGGMALAGSQGEVGERWHHGGAIVSAVEPVFEFGEVAGHVPGADGAVGVGDGALDVAESGVDPLERGVQRGLAAGPRDDRLMAAAGAAGPAETAQPVTDDGAGGREIARRQGRNFGAAEPSPGATSSGRACPATWFRPPLRSASCPANHGPRLH
jgi:hypothetical protein